MKDIAVIIINYNTAKYTLECVDSIFNHTKTELNVEVIVIDNNSKPTDFEILQNGLKVHPTVLLHRSVINTGFGAGNMLGVQFVKAKYLLFLNNDAFLQNDCLSILYDYMESHATVGVGTAQNYDENETHVASFDHDKGIRKLILGRSFLEKRFPNHYPERKMKYSDPVTVNWVNGAFMFFRSSIFAEVGGFDTNIFLYFEEMDICFRLRKKHFSSVLLPQAKITHYQGVSTGVSKTISKEAMISYLYVVKKNYSNAKYLFIKTYFCLSFLIKPKKWFLLKLILRGGRLSESLKQQQKIKF